MHNGTGLEVIKLEYNLRLKIKRIDWLHADTCPQAANHCALFYICDNPTMTLETNDRRIRLSRDKAYVTERPTKTQISLSITHSPSA